MAPESNHQSSKHRPGRNTNLRDATLNATDLILDLVKQAANLASCAELREAAAVALIIFETIQVSCNLENFHSKQHLIFTIFIGSQRQ